MGLKEKKIFNDKVKRWEEYKEVISTKEIEYANLLIKKYEKRFNEILNEFNTYIESYKLKLIKRKNFVEANLDNRLKIRIEFEEAKMAEEYKFLLIFIEEQRKEYFVAIRPKTKVYLPSLYKERPKPQSVEQIELLIDQLIKDCDFIEKEKRKLENILLNLCYYSGNNSKDTPNNPITYKSFTEILERILE
jgi:transcription-repair coupling factor (superfamily II helicase)